MLQFILYKKIEMTSSELTILFLTLYTLAIIAVGIWNRKNSNSEDFFLASRSLPAWLLSVTFIASWWGGGSAIDLVDHAHKNGLSSFWVYGVPVLIATFLMFLFAKGIRNVATISQSQLMQQRYNEKVSLLLTVFIVLFMVIGSAVQVIVVGKFFQSFFQISYAQGATLGVTIVLVYSLFGGFRGVVLTDLLQFVFFLFTAIFLFYWSYQESGGMAAVEQLAVATNKIGYTSFFHKVTDNLAYVITFGTSWMIQANVWQRISAAKKATDARRVMLFSFVAFIPLYLMVTYTGMFSSVFYTVVPQGGVVANIILQLSNPVLSAVLFVGLCAAIMSTMDSLIHTGALSLTVDIYSKHISPKASPASSVLVARLATFLIGGISLFIALRIQSILTISWIASDFLTSGAFVPLVLGFVWRKGSSRAAFVSMVFGLSFSFYNLLVALGLPLPVLWEIASAAQAIIGVGVSLCLYVSVSLLWPEDTQKAIRFINKAKQ